MPTSLHISPAGAIGKNPNTHLAVLSDGTIVYVQETDSGQDVAYAISGSEPPAPTNLTSRNILAAMGYPAGSGNIQGMSEAGGNIYFYFCGQSNRTLAACVGKYLPGTGEIKIQADTPSLRDLTDAGDSLSICHGSMATSGDTVWIFIRGLDQSIFLQMDPAFGVARRNFKALICDIMPITLDHDNYDIGGSPDGSLLVTDLWLGVLWRIKPNGQLLLERNLIGLPSAIATPSADDHGRIVLFVSPGDELTPRLESSESQRITQTTFPALLAIEPHAVTGYAGTAILAPDVAMDSLHISQLAPSPDHQSWVGFDAGTGELYRLNLVHVP